MNSNNNSDDTTSAIVSTCSGRGLKRSDVEGGGVVHKRPHAFITLSYSQKSPCLCIGMGYSPWTEKQYCFLFNNRCGRCCFFVFIIFFFDIVFVLSLLFCFYLFGWGCVACVCFSSINALIKICLCVCVCGFITFIIIYFIFLIWTLHTYVRIYIHMYIASIYCRDPDQVHYDQLTFIERYMYF